MQQTDAIADSIRQLFDAQKFAVLSTHHDGQPYASLVGFAATGDLKQIFFSTPKTTRKYTNLKANPQVAVLVNSSTNASADLHAAISVTATGTAGEIDDRHRKNFVSHYLGKHPYLKDFVNAPTTALIVVAVKRYYLVKNFQRVMELHVTQ